MLLFDQRGRRKYLTPDERRRFIEAALQAPLSIRAFCIVLAFTGCRISEALELTQRRFDVSAGELIVRSLKKRRDDMYRAIPLPPSAITLVESMPILGTNERIWPWCRATAWKRVKEVMTLASIAGTHATPKGLRHAFAIAALQSGVPLNMIQRWLGHSNIAMTALYAGAMGEEERRLAERLWRTTPF